jgi:branched-chain amino acid transport system ATP-binding protein
MTVLQNVMVGVHSRTRGDFLTNALRSPLAVREEHLMRQTAMELIEFLDLRAVTLHPAAGSPSGR